MRQDLHDQGHRPLTLPLFLSVRNRGIILCRKIDEDLTELEINLSWVINAIKFERGQR